LSDDNVWKIEEVSAYAEAERTRYVLSAGLYENTMGVDGLCRVFKGMVSKILPVFDR